MPRKKANISLRIEDGMIKNIKEEPVDDYVDEDRTDYGSIQIKSEPMEIEEADKDSAIDNSNSDFNHNQFDTNIDSTSLADSLNKFISTSVIQEAFSYPPDCEENERTNDLTWDEHNLLANQQFHSYYMENDGIDKTIFKFPNSITPEEYEKYTGKKLVLPITKKMYEHYRYMKAKVVDRNKHKCDKCARTFPFRHELARHQLYHTGVKQHACEVCGKCFVLKGQLTTHMLSHTRVRKFQCKYCPASFLLGSHLRQHLPSHNPELRIKCSFCDLSFTRKASLDRHIKRLHSDIQNANCSSCGKSHSDGCKACNCKELKDYCMICLCRLGNAKNLAIHMQTFHPFSSSNADNKNSSRDVNKATVNKTKVPSDNSCRKELKNRLLDKLLNKNVDKNRRKPKWSMQIKMNPNQNVTHENIHHGQRTENNSSNHTLPPPHQVNGTDCSRMPANEIDGSRISSEHMISNDNSSEMHSLCNNSSVINGVNMNSKRQCENNNVYDIPLICIDPIEIESRRKEEIDRVVTFKVELTEVEDIKVSDEEVKTEMKAEPYEQGIMGNDTSDRFVVYKVLDEDTSIREGFYKALCIKKEQEEMKQEMSSNSLTSVHLHFESTEQQNSLSPQAMSNTSHSTISKTQDSESPLVHNGSKVSPLQNGFVPVGKRETSVTMNNSEISYSNSCKSTKIIRPSKSKPSKFSLDSLYCKAINKHNLQ